MQLTLISSQTRNKKAVVDLEKQLLEIDTHFESSNKQGTINNIQLIKQDALSRKRDILCSICEMKEYTHTDNFILVIRDSGAELYNEKNILSKEYIYHNQFTSLYYENERIFRINVENRNKNKIYGHIEMLNNNEYREFVKLNSSNHNTCKVRIITREGVEHELTLPVSDSIYFDSLKKCNVKFEDVRKFYYISFFNTEHSYKI